MRRATRPGPPTPTASCSTTGATPIPICRRSPKRAAEPARNDSARPTRMTLRRLLHELLSNEPRSVSSLARELGLRRQDVAADLQHLLRSAAARGDRIEILPARCKACGFEFGPDRLAKPGRCPSCKASRIQEAMIQIG